MTFLLIRQSLKLFFNSTELLKNQELKMQTSITSFFKAKQAPKQSNTETRDVQDEKTVKTDVEKGVVENGGSPDNQVRSPSLKRASPDSGSDDEVVRKPANTKRVALESPESSPVKMPKTPNKSEDKGEDKNAPNIKKQEAGDSKSDEDAPTTTNISTPAKKEIVSPFTQASPLMDLNVLIKKKISSGAYALHENFGHSWFRALQGEFDKPYFKKLSEFVKSQRDSKTVFPPPDKVFTWTHFHPIRETRVVIIGQDPYHGPGQAHGLSFSVQKGVAIPKSLQNIYKELQSDIEDFKHPGHGELTGWSRQGVLMLNACLTVNKGEPNSHQGKGWENFTDAVISWISKNVNKNIVFILWGKFAQKKSSLIEKRHKILTSAHPSPFSADSGFFGCKHFSQTNAYLRSQKLKEIDWKAL